MSQDAYILKAGDTIKIHVFNEEELSLETKVDLSGTINFPFVGEVEIANKTSKEVEEIIKLKLKDGYLVNPEVNVSVLEYRPFYINGQVKSPGGFPYRPNMTVSMGIALAGGLTDSASRSDWFIKRSSEKKEKVTGESYIYPGDILIIERSFF
ncbi:polysaccharide biosynthesis/export family protein [Marinomonas sp. THO17]|uniref:polysaccharide biosynthesis/export family protein n=1 Tax=Marinomonas sp. THO17 TaxID=3149048 RepID=UPI00336BE6B9